MLRGSRIGAARTRPSAGTSPLSLVFISSGAADIINRLRASGQAFEGVGREVLEDRKPAEQREFAERDRCCPIHVDQCAAR